MGRSSRAAHAPAFGSRRRFLDPRSLRPLFARPLAWLRRRRRRRPFCLPMPSKCGCGGAVSLLLRQRGIPLASVPSPDLLPSSVAFPTRVLRRAMCRWPRTPRRVRLACPACADKSRVRSARRAAKLFVQSSTQSGPSSRMRWIRREWNTHFSEQTLSCELAWIALARRGPAFPRESSLTTSQ